MPTHPGSIETAFVDELSSYAWTQVEGGQYTKDELNNFIIEAYKAAQEHHRELLKNAFETVDQLETKINEYEEALKKRIVKSIVANRRIAEHFIEELAFDMFIDFGIGAKAFLRMDLQDAFSALFIVPEPFFLSEDVLKFYDHIHDQLEDVTVEIDVRLMPESEHTQIMSIVRDGYYSYFQREEPTSTQTGTA